MKRTYAKHTLEQSGTNISQFIESGVTTTTQTVIIVKSVFVYWSIKVIPHSLLVIITKGFINSRIVCSQTYKPLYLSCVFKGIR